MPSKDYVYKTSGSLEIAATVYYRQDEPRSSKKPIGESRSTLVETYFLNFGTQLSDSMPVASPSARDSSSTRMR